MITSYPFILFKAWSSFKREAVTVMGSRICRWLCQKMIKLMEGTRLDVESMARLMSSL